MKTLIVGESLESMLLNWAILGHKDQDTEFVWPRSVVGEQPLIGHRIVRDTAFMRDVLQEFDCDFDEEFYFNSAVITEQGEMEPLDDEPFPCLAFDTQLLLSSLIEFASPKIRPGARIENLNWDAEAQEADICISYRDSGPVEYEVLEFDNCVIDCTVSGPAAPHKSFRDNHQVVRFQCDGFWSAGRAKSQRYDVIHISPERNNIIDRLHTHGELTTAFIRGSYSIEEVLDSLKDVAIEPKLYDWNNRPVYIPHLMSVSKQATFVPWTMKELSEVQYLAQEVVR